MKEELKTRRHTILILELDPAFREKRDGPRIQKNRGSPIPARLAAASAKRVGDDREGFDNSKSIIPSP